VGAVRESRGLARSSTNSALQRIRGGDYPKSTPAPTLYHLGAQSSAEAHLWAPLHLITEQRKRGQGLGTSKRNAQMQDDARLETQREGHLPSFDPVARLTVAFLHLSPRAEKCYLDRPELAALGTQETPRQETIPTADHKDFRGVHETKLVDLLRAQGLPASEAWRSRVPGRPVLKPARSRYRLAHRQNAIWRPSGDQAGLYSGWGSLVSRKAPFSPSSLT
jgi:hypothetical protein